MADETTGSDTGGGGGAGWGGALGALGVGLLSYFGQDKANQTNMDVANAQMAFQERMSGSAYQRAVEDMKAAGINPMLAAHTGGANSPAGTMPRVENAVGAGVSSAAQAQNTILQAQQLESNKVGMDNVRAQTAKLITETVDSKLNTALAAAELDRRLASSKGAWYDAFNKEDDYVQMNTQGGFRARVAALMAEARRSEFGAGRDELTFKDDVNMRHSEARKKDFEAQGAGLGLNREKAYSSFFGSDVGKSYPYIEGGLDVLKGVSSARRAVRR